jgi:hypothetical protein
MFEHNCVEQLLMLAGGVGRGEDVDPGQLLQAAVRVHDNPPQDWQLAAIADRLVQRCCDWANFGGSRRSVAVATLSYELASLALEMDEFLNKRDH